MPAIVISAPISSNHAAPVSAGGTGATTAAAARTNLDVYSKSEVTNAISQSTANFLAHGNTIRGKNLNDLRPQNGGIYMYNGYGSSDVTGTLPFTNSFGILFCGENGYGGYLQIMIELTTGKVYRRMYESGAWNAWSAPT